jgi:CHAD domain-containing protein
VAKAEIEWDERRGPAVNARSVLPRLVSDYFSEVRAFLAKDRKPAEFHRMRLASKRLRYTLELFRPCYGPGLEQRIAALKDLQDVLGDLNDAVATLALLGHDIGRKERAFLKHRAAEKAKDFRKQWTQSFDAPSRELWWTTYLAEHARTPHNPSRNR